MTDKTAIAALLADVTYSAEFVPFSKSRNAKEDRPSLNWRVTLAARGRTITTDYMQGVGHLPHYSHAFARIVVYADAVKAACETGKSTLRAGQRNAWDACRADSVFHKAAPIPAPDLLDVVYCLVSDAGALDAASFEDWANECGYDIDSRKAEATYRECLAHALELRAMLGDARLSQLRDLFSDY